MARAIDDTVYPWERQKGESESAYAAFVYYRDHGPIRRYVETARALGRTDRWIRKLASLWDWKKRAELYDRDFERKAKAAAEQEKKEMIVRHIDIGLRVQEKAMEGLKRLNVKRMGAISVQSLLDFGTKIERESRVMRDEDAGELTDAASILTSVLNAAWSDDDSDGEKDSEHD